MKQLSAIENKIKLEFLPDDSINNHNKTGNAHTVCNQIIELEKFIANNISKTTFDKIKDLRLNFLLIDLCEELGRYNGEEVRSWRKNLMDHGSIYEIKYCKL